MNHLKCKTLMQGSWAYKKPLTIVEISRRVRPCGVTLYQKVEIFAILGPRSQPHAPIGMKFCSVKRTHVPLGRTKFHMNRCNESPLRGENVDF